MNFQELMSKASANNNNASKQLTKPGHKHKNSADGVSNSAVKAFLEKKEQEQKKKQANEEAAKRSRIQARLHQNLKANQGKKGKSESTPKSSFLNPPYAHGEEEEEEKTIPVKRKRSDVLAQHQKSGVSCRLSGMKRNRSATISNMKTKSDSESISKEKRTKSKDFVVNEKKNDAVNAKKKSKTIPAPPNFKELLAIAEQNKSGLKRMKRKTEAVTGKGKVDIEPSKLKRRYDSGGEHELTEIDEKNRQIKNNGKVKEKGATNAKGKQTKSQQKTAVEPDRSRVKNRSHVNESLKAFKRTRVSNMLGKKIFDKKTSKCLPHHARPQEQPQHRMMYEQKNYYPIPTHDKYYDEEEDSDLDGFIDDGEDEMCAQQTDVSKYIKDIFGYDRQRYAMVDDNDSAMESNYGQIEREEKRSAKIAKLEDEIEILKEQAELKRLRDKLKNSKKPKSK